MEINVRFPGSQLGQIVGKSLQSFDLDIPDPTVEDVIGTTITRYPALRERFYIKGNFNRNLLLSLDGEDIRFLGDLKTPICDYKELSITGNIAGG